MLKDEIYYEFITEGSPEEIIKLYEQAGWWKETEHARAIIPQMIRGSFCFAVAKNKKEIIGMGRVLSDGCSDAYIQDLIVHKDYRGQGIGKKIVSMLVNFCLDNKMEEIFLIAEPNTSNFYKAIGFRSLKNFEPLVYG